METAESEACVTDNKTETTAIMPKAAEQVDLKDMLHIHATQSDSPGDPEDKTDLQRPTINIIGGYHVIGDNCKIEINDASLKKGKIDINDASQRLKLRYQQQLKAWNVPMINSNKDFYCVEKERDRYMVDLRIIEGREVDEECRHFNEISQYKERLLKSSTDISPGELVHDEIRSTFVRGVAGVGKTSLVEYIALEWAKGEVFQEIDFLFFLKCRNLIKYKDRKMTIQDLFKDQFQVDVESLQEVLDGDRVLIILDGLDELPSLETVLEADSENDLNSILSSLMRKDGELFPGHKMILTGRPYIQSVLLKHESHATGRLNIVDITGLSETSIIAYVDNFAEGNDEVKARILNTINESESLKAMASIPQFLSSLCCILTMESGDVSIQKTTELYVWILVSFIRQHFPEFKEMPYNILKDKRVNSFIKIVSEISYKLLVDNKMIFEEGEFDKLHAVEDEIVKKMLDSFLMKIETSFGCLYQFKHLTLQEFLASVYCFENGIGIQELLDRKLYELVAFISGLARANKYGLKEKGNVLSMFAKCIRSEQKWYGFLVIDKRPTVDNITVNIFDQFNKRKVNWRVLWMIFFELFNDGDKVTPQVRLKDEIPTIAHHFRRSDCLLLAHFIKTMLNSRGRKSLRGIKLKMIGSELTLGNSKELAPLLKYVVQVSLIGGTIDVEFVKEMVREEPEPAERKNNLRRLAFSGCDLSAEHFKYLSPSFPVVKSVDRHREKVSCMRVSKKVDGKKSAAGKMRVRELALRDCSLDDDAVVSMCELIPSLAKCDLSHIQLTSQNIKEIARCVSGSNDTNSPSNLKLLCLSTSALNPECIDDLCLIIPNVCAIYLSEDPNRSLFRVVDSKQLEKIVECIERADKLGSLRLQELVLNCEIQEIATTKLLRLGDTGTKIYRGSKLVVG
eukprot:Seg3051.2 transcript_id=Seg3051.2/GoldUCD/mRNA.D3Y31 product="NACHT LRR and PYD domains-containing protein 12" protein_id=Seg3051.2/GoldUCD/D3Y31